MKNRNGNGWIIGAALSMLLLIFLFIGEVKCIVKAVNCDWEAPYKAEVIYTASACTGVGAIVGWINIKD